MYGCHFHLLMNIGVGMGRGMARRQFSNGSHGTASLSPMIYTCRIQNPKAGKQKVHCGIILGQTWPFPQRYYLRRITYSHIVHIVCPNGGQVTLTESVCVCVCVCVLIPSVGRYRRHWMWSLMLFHCLCTYVATYGTHLSIDIHNDLCEQWGICCRLP